MFQVRYLQNRKPVIAEFSNSLDACNRLRALFAMRIPAGVFQGRFKIGGCKKVNGAWHWNMWGVNDIIMQDTQEVETTNFKLIDDLVDKLVNKRDEQRDLEEGWLSDINYNNGK